MSWNRSVSTMYFY